MSNLLLLAQLPATVIDILTDADWLDQIFQPQPGWPASPTQITGSLSAASQNVTGLASTNGIVQGQPVTGIGVQPGTTIQTITPPSEIALSQDPLITLAGAQLNVWGLPLDLAGISFRSQIRVSITDPSVLLECSTANGMMTNGGPSGCYGWNVLKVVLAKVPWPASLQCVADIVATDGVNTINLCEANGPITLNISQGVTR